MSRLSRGRELLREAIEDANEESIVMNMKPESPGEPDVARDATYHRAPDSAARPRERHARRTWRAPSAGRLSGAGLAFAASFAAVSVVSWNLALITARGSPRRR